MLCFLRGIMYMILDICQMLGIFASAMETLSHYYVVCIIWYMISGVLSLGGCA